MKLHPMFRLEKKDLVWFCVWYNWHHPKCLDHLKSLFQCVYRRSTPSRNCASEIPFHDLSVGKAPPSWWLHIQAFGFSGWWIHASQGINRNSLLKRHQNYFSQMDLSDQVSGILVLLHYVFISNSTRIYLKSTRNVNVLCLKLYLHYKKKGKQYFS